MEVEIGHVLIKALLLTQVMNITFFDSINFKGTAEVYVGQAGSGAHVHKHDPAMNFLAQGTKQWYVQDRVH